MNAGWKGWLQFGAGLAVAAAVVALIGPVFNQWKRSKLPEGWLLVRPPHEVSAVLVEGAVVWAGGRGGLHLIDAESGKLLEAPTGAESLERVRALLRDSGGAVWVAHGGGILRCGSTCAAVETPGGAWLALMLRRDGTILAGGERGLAFWTGTQFRLTDRVETLGLKDVDVLCEDSTGRLWTGSSAPVNGGLLEGTPGGPWRREHPSLPHPSVSMVLEDRDGALWIATGFGREGGAVREKDGVRLVLTKAEGLAGEKARTIYQDSGGRIWIGSEYDGIVYSDGGGWRKLTPEDGLAGWEVKSIAEDARGNYWMGTEDGVTRMPPLAGGKQ